MTRQLLRLACHIDDQAAMSTNYFTIFKIPGPGDSSTNPLYCSSLGMDTFLITSIHTRSWNKNEGSLYVERRILLNFILPAIIFCLTFSGSEHLLDYLCFLPESTIVSKYKNSEVFVLDFFEGRISQASEERYYSRLVECGLEQDQKRAAAARLGDEATEWC